MEYMSVKEASKLWGYSEATIRRWCKEGKINISVGTKKENGHWYIPVIAECPKKKKV